MNQIFNIRKIRETRGFSQEYVADKLGVSQSAYCKMERNIRKVAFGNVLKITNVLNITADEFLSADTQNNVEVG